MIKLSNQSCCYQRLLVEIQFYLKEILMTYENFHSDLTNILNGEYEKEIHDWDKIKAVLLHIVKNNYQGFGRNIVDFIDRGSWDRITKIDFKDGNRQLELTWNNGWLYHASIETILIIEHERAFLY